MTTIGFASWKGGTGKSLLAFNTAERAESAGLKTLLCDFDPQMTIIEQCDIRSSLRPEAPRLEAVKGSLTIEGIEALRRISQGGEYDLLICDLPGADTFTMDQALAAMDLLLIPITAAPFEIMTTAKLVHKGILHDWKMILVPNNLPGYQGTTPNPADNAHRHGYRDCARGFSQTGQPLGCHSGRAGGMRVCPRQPLRRRKSRHSGVG